MKKTLTIFATILGILLIALAIFYWITPAGSLPAFFPGFIAGSMIIHIKHGIASLLLGFALLIYAWFASAKKAY